MEERMGKGGDMKNILYIKDVNKNQATFLYYTDYS
jgi:hypothetical protein